jgi:D-beta-D-heptose 7-phosphate kinase / D-beta-D-heptose 1-phosphate adenosyltransferase
MPETNDELSKTIAKWRAAGNSIVMTSGVFDLIHRGHVDTLSRMRQLGDRLLIAINTDESVRRKKGPLRPINCLADRLFALANLRSVDAVISFDEPGEQPVDLVAQIKPDVFVKARAEWSEESFGGFKKTVEAYGGRAELIDSLPGYSTTGLIKKILAVYRDKK